MAQITIATNKDGTVDIRMDGSTPFDWFTLLESALDNIRDALESTDSAALSDDDQQVYEWLECWVREVETLNSDLDNEIQMQKSDSRCEFFYGPPRKPTPPDPAGPIDPGGSAPG